MTINGGTLGNTSGGEIILFANNLQSWDGDFAFAGTAMERMTWTWARVQ